MRYIEKWNYSYKLNRTLNIKIYGHYGTTILVFPCQNQMSNDFSNNGMIDTLSDYIEQGKIKLVCVDSIDQECISDVFGDKGHRSYMQEQYYQYIYEEVLPVIYEDNGGFTLPLVMGLSSGATHAAATFFRRPDLFMGLLSLSGMYDSSFFYDFWCDERVYNNSPQRFIKNMDNSHPYINLYNSKKIVICMGQGMFENIAAFSFYDMRDTFSYKGINAWFDVWGNDVSHDWYWWKAQARYYLPIILGF